MKRKYLIFLLLLFIPLVLSAKVIEGRLLGVDPDGVIKMIDKKGKVREFTFDPFKIRIKEYVIEKDKKEEKNNKKIKKSKKGYFRNSSVFEMKIGDEIKVFLQRKTIVKIKFRESNESLRDFYFKSRKVKMYKGKFKNVDTGRGLLLMADKTQFILTPYTHFIPYFGSYSIGDTLVVGYVEGQNGEKIAKWVKLRARK